MDEESKTSTIKTDTEIESMRDFLLENQDIKLENLPRYEDLITPKINIDTAPSVKGMTEVNTLPYFDAEVKKEEKPKPKRVSRFKIAVGTFAVVGVLLFALTIINGGSLALLNKEHTDNRKDIATLTEQVEQLKNESIDTTLTENGTEKWSYKLALPRNYPKDSADLTWFDKLSIFLMKLFG